MRQYSENTKWGAGELQLWIDNEEYYYNEKMRIFEKMSALAFKFGKLQPMRTTNALRKLAASVRKDIKGSAGVGTIRDAAINLAAKEMYEEFVEYHAAAAKKVQNAGTFPSWMKV